MKEQLVKFDGTALFPPRYAKVVRYDLSGPEADVYEHVTTYEPGPDPDKDGLTGSAWLSSTGR